MEMGDGGVMEVGIVVEGREGTSWGGRRCSANLNFGGWYL